MLPILSLVIIQIVKIESPNQVSDMTTMSDKIFQKIPPGYNSHAS